jgi:hypothetical protein
MTTVFPPRPRTLSRAPEQLALNRGSRRRGCPGLSSGQPARGSSSSSPSERSERAAPASIPWRLIFGAFACALLIGAAGGCSSTDATDPPVVDPVVDSGAGGGGADAADAAAGDPMDADAKDGAVDAHHAACGDGTKNGAESCDGTAFGTSSCVSLGFAGGTLACSNNCTFDTTSCFKCGDGAKNGAESCDGTAFGTSSCVSLGFAGGTLACTNDCALNMTSCFKCGDGTKNGVESCDGADVGSASCASLGFAGGTLACTNDCTLNTTSCFKCGDGIKNGAESCDGVDLGAASCQSLGFVSGTLACSPTCTWNTSQCVTACAINSTPQLTLPPTVTVTPGQPFGLHATVQDDDPASALTISWTGAGGAPSLAGANTLDPSGVAGECGTFDYKVTVTDPCAHSASATIRVTVPANGPYVSSFACIASQQCGSVRRPWCTIQLGVDHTSTGQVNVAGANVAYVENVIMRNGVDVLGGFESTFSAPRNPDPVTNKTTVQSAASAFTWPAGTLATVDGIRVLPTMPPASANQRSVFAISGDANASLVNVRLESSVGSAKYSFEYGIRVNAGQGGSLLVQSSVIQGPVPTYKSVALSTDPAANGSVTVSQSSLQSASVSGNGTISIGLEQAGTGSLIVQGGKIRAGLAKRTYGVYASSTTSPAARQLELDGVIVEGNRGDTAYGVYVDGGARLWIHNGSVQGKGSADYLVSPTTTGVSADSVVEVALDGVTVLATDAVAGYQQPPSAYAVSLSNSRNVAQTSATILNATLEGGSVGHVRRGVLSNGVPLDIRQSHIVASRSLIAESDFSTSGLVGVELTGSFPPATQIVVKQNPEIIGGDAQATCFNPDCGSAGILFNTAVDSLIEQNTLIQGAYFRSGFGAAGIRINKGGTHVIQRNETIAAGFGSDSSVSAGVQVASVGTAIANVTLTDNTLVVGNPSAGRSSETPVGFYGRGVNATIRNNRILGGYGYNSMGIWIEGPNPSWGNDLNMRNTVNITGNAIDGGTGGTGAFLMWQTGTVTDNVIQACGIVLPNGQPAADCLQSTSQSIGLSVAGDAGSLIANNYVFGGYTAETTACRLGCFASVSGVCPPGLSTTFVYNLCAVRSTAYSSTSSKATALDLGKPASGDCPLIANNILDASGTVGTVRTFSHFESGVNSTPTECYQFFDNDLVPRGLACAGYVYLPPTLCYADAAALNTHGNAVQQMAGNVSILPGYAAENLSAPSATGYHLDATCALGRLGVPVGPVTVDYDNATRDPLQPGIGPDECP